MALFSLEKEAKLFECICSWEDGEDPKRYSSKMELSFVPVVGMIFERVKLAREGKHPFFAIIRIDDVRYNTQTGAFRLDGQILLKELK